MAMLTCKLPLIVRSQEGSCDLLLEFWDTLHIWTVRARNFKFEFTWFRENQTPSCFYCVNTDDPDVLEEMSYLEPLGKSDHVCISWHLCFTSRPATEERKYNYWKADYSAIREKLSSINWNLEFENKAVNDMWKYFVSVTGTCVSDSVPLYKPKAKKKKSPWLSSDSKVAPWKRKKAWQEYAKNISIKRFFLCWMECRHGIAMRKLSVKRVHCDKTEERSLHAIRKII